MAIRSVFIAALGLLVQATIASPETFTAPVRGPIRPVDSGSQFSAEIPATWFATVWPASHNETTQSVAREERTTRHPGVDSRYAGYGTEGQLKEFQATAGQQASGSGVTRRVVPSLARLTYRHTQYPSWGERTHLGVDILATAGDPVFPFADGTVVAICNSERSGTCSPDFGNAVMVRHSAIGLDGGDLYSIYLHLQARPAVRIGTSVLGGSTQLGLVGRTGAANGVDHVHFEIRHFSQWLSSRWNNIYCPGNCKVGATASYIDENWEDPENVRLMNCRYRFGQEATVATESMFRKAYDQAGAAVGLGCATSAVRTDGFKSFAGTTAHFQTFERGSIQYPLTAGQAFSIVDPLRRRWNLFGLAESHPLGYPTSVLSEIQRASTGTMYRFQRFEGGSLNWHVSGSQAGEVFEAHGAIYEKWGQLGYADWLGGLPAADERGVFRAGGRFSQFESGHIWWKNGAASAFATQGKIDDVYLSAGGASGWLGFPVSDRYVAADGRPRSDFEHGHITTKDGVNYEAVREGCTYTLSPGNVAVAAGGSLLENIRVTTQSGCSWTAKSNDEWISVFLSGLGAVVYSVTSNPLPRARTGTLTIGNQVFTVQQAGASQPASQEVPNTLRPVDFDRYCRAQGGERAINIDGTGYGWRCMPGEAHINVDEACRQQYGQRTRAELVSPAPGGESDWRCRVR